jgi:hypothetical protein
VDEMVRGAMNAISQAVYHEEEVREKIAKG